MGYTTDFTGEFTITPMLSNEHRYYLEAFNHSRRMKRDAALAEKRDDPIRLAAGLPIGIDGAYFVGNTHNFGQDHDDSVIDGNIAPGQPSRAHVVDHRVLTATEVLRIVDAGGYVSAGSVIGEACTQDGVHSEHDCEWGFTGLPNQDPGAVQPGLWCQWVPDDLGNELVWDEGEKFYAYIEWLDYLLAHFLIPWGYTLNGEVTWRGEDYEDRGKIALVNNKRLTYEAETQYRRVD